MGFTDIFSDFLDSLSVTNLHAEAPPEDDKDEESGGDDEEGKDKEDGGEDGGQEGGDEGGDDEGGDDGGDDEEEEEEEEEEEPEDPKPALEEGKSEPPLGFPSLLILLVAAAPFPQRGQSILSKTELSNIFELSIVTQWLTTTHQNVPDQLNASRSDTTTTNVPSECSSSRRTPTTKVRKRIVSKNVSSPYISPLHLCCFVNSVDLTDQSSIYNIAQHSVQHLSCSSS